MLLSSTHSGWKGRLVILNLCGAKSDDTSSSDMRPNTKIGILFVAVLNDVVESLESHFRFLIMVSSNAVTRYILLSIVR